MAVFLPPIFYTLGGLSMILVFSAKSGLFLVRVSVMRVNKNLYLDSLVAAISACLIYSSLAFYFSAFLSLFFFLMSISMRISSLNYYFSYFMAMTTNKRNYKLILIIRNLICKNIRRSHLIKFDVQIKYLYFVFLIH